MGYRATNKMIYSAKCHIIWCPKYRRCVLTGGVETRLKRVIAQVGDEAGGQVIEGGAPLEVVRRYVENQKRAA